MCSNSDDFPDLGPEDGLGTITIPYKPGPGGQSHHVPCNSHIGKSVEVSVFVPNKHGGMSPFQQWEGELPADMGIQDERYRAFITGKIQEFVDRLQQKRARRQCTAGECMMFAVPAELIKRA